MSNEDIYVKPPAGKPSRGKILFADDDPQVSGSIGQCLIRAGFDCDFADTAAKAVELLRAGEYDVLLSDINMPGNSGLELIENIPTIADGLPVILLTGKPTLETAARSVRLRVTAYLTKPPDIEELCRLVAASVAERRQFLMLKESRRRLQDWDREIERLQKLLQQPSAADRQAPMRSYLRLTLRHLVVGLIELENLLIHEGGQLDADRVIEKQALLNALRKTVGVLQKTRDHFKSKDLGELRKELEGLLG